MSLNSLQNYFSIFQIISNYFIHKCMFITLVDYVCLFQIYFVLILFNLFCGIFSLYMYVRTHI